MTVRDESDQGGGGRRRTSAAGAGPDGLMVFDGTCGFCSANARAVLKIDKHGAIRFTPIQSPYGRELAGRFGIDADDPSTFLFFERGRPLEASDAAVALARRLPRPWRWLSALAIVPRPLRDAAYGFVARHRYRIAGRSAACMVPSPSERARFVETSPGSAEPSSSAKRPE